MRVTILFVFCCFISSVSFSQTYSIKGKIVASDILKPVANAAVYLSNTSVGIASNNNGEFILKFSMNGRFNLIVSCFGYETYVQNIQTDKLPEELVITLKPKINDLGNVEVRAFDKNGWAKWGSLFIENFIGTSAYAYNCTIKNESVIKFHFLEKKNELVAFANEPIIIENRTLGYIIHYKLEEFRLNFDSKFLLFTGYPLFEEMASKRISIKVNWKKKREEVYYGSMTHFMRSLFKDELVKEGFEVHALKKVNDEERNRVYDLFERAKNQYHVVTIPDVDTLFYYNAVINNKDVTEIVFPFLLNKRNLLSPVDTTVSVLSFSNFLDVRYRRKDVPNEYIKYLPRKTRMGFQKSILGLLSADYVKVYANGSYFDPQNLFAEGYWSWWEKMATMLPFDYEPSNNFQTETIYLKKPNSSK